MASLLRIKDNDGISKLITNSQVIQIDSYYQSHHIDYVNEADCLYCFLKAVCSDSLFNEINKRFDNHKTKRQPKCQE